MKNDTTCASPSTHNILSEHILHPESRLTKANAQANRRATTGLQFLWEPRNPISPDRAEGCASCPLVFFERPKQKGVSRRVRHLIPVCVSFKTLLFPSWRALSSPWLWAYLQRGGGVVFTALVAVWRCGSCRGRGAMCESSVTPVTDSKATNPKAPPVLLPLPHGRLSIPTFPAPLLTRFPTGPPNQAHTPARTTPPRSMRILFF